jgi:hypothetical protein
MLVEILSVEPHRVRFSRLDDGVPRNHLRLSGSSFPFDLLKVGQQYGIISSRVDDLWSWTTGYELGVELHAPIVRRKEAR